MTAPSRLLKPLRRRLFPRRYPIWSVKTISIVAIFVVGITATCIFVFGERSLLVETNLVLGTIAVALFMFLTVGLYHGVRVRRDDLTQAKLKGVSFQDMMETAPDLRRMPDINCPVDIVDGGDEGCLGAIVAGLVSLVALAVLVAVLWLLINVGLAVAIVLMLAVGWVFYRALRQVFARSRQCRGRIGPSVGYALLYTILYTGWLFALVFLAGWIVA